MGSVFRPSSLHHRGSFLIHLILIQHGYFLHQLSVLQDAIEKKSSLDKLWRLANNTSDAFQDTVEDDESKYEGGWLIRCSFGATMPYEVEVVHCVPTTDCDRATCNKL